MPYVVEDIRHSLFILFGMNWLNYEYFELMEHNQLGD